MNHDHGKPPPLSPSTGYPLGYGGGSPPPAPLVAGYGGSPPPAPMVAGYGGSPPPAPSTYMSAAGGSPPPPSPATGYPTASSSRKGSTASQHRQEEHKLTHQRMGTLERREAQLDRRDARIAAHTQARLDANHC